LPLLPHSGMRAVHELEALHRRRSEAWPRREPMRAVLWLLEELRVSRLAQQLGARGQVSGERIRRILDEAVSARPGR
jgi:hypothetical protein